MYDKAMMGEFSQFEENSGHHSNSISYFAAGLARVQVNLVVDPVSLFQTILWNVMSFYLLRKLRPV